MRTPTAVSKASFSFETFSDFLLFGGGLFVDLVFNIDYEAHDLLSLSDAVSELSKSAKE